MNQAQSQLTLAAAFLFDPLAISRATSALKGEPGEKPSKKQHWKHRSSMHLPGRMRNLRGKGRSRGGKRQDNTGTEVRHGKSTLLMWGVMTWMLGPQTTVGTID